MPDSELNGSPDASSKRFFSKENTARIGRFTISFPFSAILGCLLIPVLVVAAGVSIPITHIRGYFERRREARFTAEMKTVGRWFLWGEAGFPVTDEGTFIEEYLSVKGPYRLWWTAEDISTISPHPCCFVETPWEFELDDKGFFDWCRRRYTDPETGTAAIVDRSKAGREEIASVLAEFRTRSRCVAIWKRYFKDPPGYPPPES